MKIIKPDDDDINFWESELKDIVPLKKNNNIILNKKTIQANNVKIDDCLASEIEYCDRGINVGSPVLESFMTDKRTIDKKLKNIKKFGYKKIDLHNLSINDAFAVLLDFVQNNYIKGNKILLVVTGIGRSNSENTIRNNMKKWILNTEIRKYVAHYRSGGNGYGGNGSFFLILRSNNKFN